MAGVCAATEGLHAVGVEPATIPTLRTALEQGGPTDVSVSGVAADSLGARRLGDIAYDVATRWRAVPAGHRQRHHQGTTMLWDQYRIVVEHGAATAFAALTSGAYVPAPDERVVVVMCGANTSPGDL